MAKQRHTYELGIVGNCSYLAYIDKAASVQWMCWPFFDSSFIFGGLLDDEKGGEFSIRPVGEDWTSTQQYRTNTNVLETLFTCADGKFRVLDFAPRFELFERHHRPLMLFRKIERLEGHPKIRVKCDPRGDYGKQVSSAVLGSNHIAYSGLDQNVRLTTNISKVHVLNESAFVLSEDKYLVLSWGKGLEAPLESTFEEFLRKTKQYWRKWVERSFIPDFASEAIIRSSLILKLHQYEDTGAIIAAGTTSLPEHPGSGRNWDYRYCWMRDSYFTLSAFSSMGHFSEAWSYAHYLQNLSEGDHGELQPMYKIDGTGEIPEWEADLKGHEGNGPVRIGNLAYKQIQYDVYGQVLLSLLPLFIDKRIYNQDYNLPPKAMIHKLLDRIADVFDKPDAGIWEYRNKKQLHCHSYLFHWAGSKAAVKIAQALGDNELLRKSEKLVVKSSEWIEKCWQEDKGYYSMAVDNKAMDASQFLLVNMGYLRNQPERAISHVKALEENLVTHECLVYRYRDLDDFGETHSTFLICGFWYAEALAAIGRIDDASKVFYGLLKTSNHLQIFSEDIDPKDGSQWGNFGQTYSHVGAINTAIRIARHIDRAPFE